MQRISGLQLTISQIMRKDISEEANLLISKATLVTWYMEIMKELEEEGIG